MPVLVPGVAVRSRRPTLLVENDLAVGSWLFRLAVVDDAGLESKPAELVVRVVARTDPGPIADIGPVVVPGPSSPSFAPAVLAGRAPGPPNPRKSPSAHPVRRSQASHP